MPEIAIKVKNISKKYSIGAKARGSLRETLVDKWSLLTGKIKTNSEEFWALKDVSFEVQQGAVLGIIGKNGAGKSTLLKILSRITEPTTGKITINGRVSSLLEVGTGFHPELTGRENIFLNGTILGMTRKEIKSKLDEIVDFSGVEKFIDTPVKHYSSGMYVRLAFAVAAHLEPEVLIIDEVLAVGDAEFQKKCLGKMKDVAGQGRTVLFVSHNLNAIQNLCNIGLILYNGKIEKFSQNINELTQYYLFNNTVKKSIIWENINCNYENEFIIPKKIYLTVNNLSLDIQIIDSLDFVKLIIEIDVKRTDPKLTLGYSIFNEEDILIYWSYTSDDNNLSITKRGYNVLTTNIPVDILNEGEYRIELCGGIDKVKWLYEPSGLNPSIFFTLKKTKTSLFWVDKRPGVLAINNKWEIN